MKKTSIPAAVLAMLTGFFAAPAAGQHIRVDPVGVNVNASGATTVFLTFGGITGFRPAEAVWCGDLMPAAPDIGFKCNPATIFGSLPARYDLSTPSGVSALTDIMSIPPSVARRAYDSALAGNPDSEFFYVRRFLNLLGGPDEYVVVTCRMTAGGARSPLSLTEVVLSFAVDTPVLLAKRGEEMPAFNAEISYTGTGRLKGRWEVVLPGDEVPEARDLLTEASLPIEQRGSQRRYVEIGRFNVFLPPSGRTVLEGPDPSRLPRDAEGPHLILLRIEASDDREADSDLRAVGAGPGVVHSGAVAGFPMPVLRYFVGGDRTLTTSRGELALLEPSDLKILQAGDHLRFTWTETESAAMLRLDVEDDEGQPLHAALLSPGIGFYLAPPWLAEKAAGKVLRWRITAFDPAGAVMGETPKRSFRFVPRTP